MKYAAKVAILAVGSILLVLVLASVVYGAAPQSAPVAVNVSVNDFLEMTPPSSVTLAQINGTGGASEQSATWHVATNNDNGYKLEVSATGSPAMTKGADSFADYSGPGAWSMAATDSAFGFSVNGTNGYRGLNGASPIQVFSNSNETAGEDTIIFFKAAVGTSHLQASGAYSANLTVTATTL